MAITKYIKTSDDFLSIKDAHNIGASKALLYAAEKKLEELRKKKPMRCDADLKKDLVFILGGIEILTWLLELPREAAEYYQKLPEGREL